MCVCLSLTCLLGGSAGTLHSLFFPSAASRKGFPSTKRSNSQCKATLAAPSSLAWKLNSPCAHQSSLFFFFSSSLFRLPFLSGSLSHSPSQDRIPFLTPSLQSLPVGFQDRCSSPPLNDQTTGLVSTQRSHFRPHLCQFLSPHLLSILPSIRRSIRRQPLEISRNISLTLLIRPGFSTPGGGTPPSSCPGIH